MKIAWDNRVLALGLAGGILSSPEVAKSLGVLLVLIIVIGTIVIM